MKKNFNAIIIFHEAYSFLWRGSFTFRLALAHIISVFHFTLAHTFEAIRLSSIPSGAGLLREWRQKKRERMKEWKNPLILTFFSFLLCLSWWWKKRRKENGRIKFNIMPCNLTSPFSLSFVLKSLFIQYTEKLWWRKKAIVVVVVQRKFFNISSVVRSAFSLSPPCMYETRTLWSLIYHIF